MNALATHVGDGRWVVETPRPVAEVDKVVTVPSPSMMSVAGAGPMQPMAAVWPQDGAWVAPFPGAAPGVVTWQGLGAPFMQVPSEPWFEGAGELAEVPEADDHGGCGTNEAFEAAYLAAAAEASARGVIEPGERREALIDALMEEAAQAERAKFQAMVASGEVKVWEDDEDESHFDPQGRPFELPKRLWQRLEEDAATEDVTSSSTSSNTSPSPWLRPAPANPLVPPATWSVGEQLRRCGHAVPLYTWTTTKLQGPGGAKVDYSGDPARMKAEAETRVKAKLLTQMHAPPRTLGRATKLQMVDTEAGWAGLVTPVGTKKMSVVGWQAFTKLGKPDESTDDGSDRLHWPLAKAAPGESGPQASSSTSLGTPAPTQGTPTPPIFPAGVCDDGELLPHFPGYSYALDIEPGGLDFTPVVAEVVKTLHDGWWALERVQRYLPEERVLAWNDDRGASSAGSPSMEHHFGPYSKALLRELQKLLAEAAERWVLGFPRKTTAPTASFKVGVGSDGTIQPSTSPLRRRVQFRLSGKLSVCTSSSGIRRTDAAQRVYIDYCNTWQSQALETQVRSLLEVSIGSITNGGALVDWLMERARAQGSSAPYPVARCDLDGGVRPTLCAPPRGYRTLRTENAGIDELLRAAYWATYFAFVVARAQIERSPADRARGWLEKVWIATPNGGIPTQSEIPIPMEDVSTVPFGETAAEAGYRQYLKSLAERFPSWDTGWDGAWPAVLRATSDLGKKFVSTDPLLEVDLVDTLPLDAGGGDQYFAWGGPSRLVIRKDVRKARTGETLRELIGVLLGRVSNETMAHLHRVDWVGSGGPTVAERARQARYDLAGWLSGRYLVLGGCGPQECAGADATSIDRPPLDPMVDASAMKSGLTRMVQVQWALTTLDVYAIACTPATGGPSGSEASASWAGAFGDPALFDHTLSGHKYLGPYDVARVAQLRAVIDECFQIFGDAGVNLDEVTLGQDVGVYRVVVLDEDDWFDPGFESGSWRASNPRTLYVKRTATGEFAQMHALLQAVIRAAQARMVFKNTWTGAVDARALAEWAANYWFNYGSCVPNFTSALGKSSFVQQYDCGTQGIRIRGANPGREREMRRRLQESFILVEAAWRYVYRITLLPEADQKNMWRYGEGWLASCLVGANSYWAKNIGLKPSLRPNALSNWPLVDGCHYACPSLEFWFGSWHPDAPRYISATLAWWLRHISRGFRKNPLRIGVMWYESHVSGELIPSYHWPISHVHMRLSYKRKSQKERQELMIHEWMHWTWYETFHFFRDLYITHQGLPRDVESVRCYASDDLTCYDELNSLYLAEYRTGLPYWVGRNQAMQNNDNFVSFVLAFRKWNEEVARVNSGSRVAGWPGLSPSPADIWIPDPIAAATAVGCNQWHQPEPGGVNSVCRNPPPEWVAPPDTSAVELDDYCGLW